MAAMLFVNDPGDWGHLFSPLDHAAWNGATPTDFIFPFFLFITGLAGFLSIARREEAGLAASTLAWRATVRGSTLILIGWALAAFPFTLERLAHLRIPGVLPRIGLVTILGTWILLLLKRKRAISISLAIVLLLALHTFLLTGLSYDLSLEANIQRAVDEAVLKGHLWKRGAWDPEGLVSTLSALATFLTGTLAGLFLKSEPRRRARLLRLAAAGTFAVVAGLVFSVWLPLNKNLWTASYVLVTSGSAALLLGLFLTLPDRWARRLPFSFLVPFGINPLLAFVLSGFLVKNLSLVKVSVGGRLISLHTVIFRGAFSWISDPRWASHAYALAMLLVWYFVLRLLQRRGVTWTV